MKKQSSLPVAICLGLLTQLTALICAHLQPSYVPTENIKFDCSSSSSETDLDFPEEVHRVPSGDASSSAPPQAHACIYRKQITHPFPVSPGPKFVRLHFFPASYQDLSISDAIFSVSVGQYTLLRATPASYSADRSTGNIVIREYIIDVDGEMLNLTFTPSNVSSGTYAFVNVIEVVSMPQNLYIQEVAGNSLKVLETAHRINVGGPSIPQDRDTGMLRQWFADDDYAISPKRWSETLKSAVELNYSTAVPAYTCPEEVYSTAITPMEPGEDPTWLFLVDPGFEYLIRFHFCDSAGQTGQVSKKSFKIHINSTGTAEDHIILINLTGQPIGGPIYRDYIIKSSVPVNTTLDGFQISISTNSTSLEVDSWGILNGLEVFKMPDSRGNLAGLYPFGTAIFHNPRRDHKKLIVMLMAAMVYAPSLWFMCLLCRRAVSRLRGFWFSCRKRISECRNQSYDHCQRFSLTAIMSATNSFSKDLLIGVGGFGKVYKGSLDNGITTVAIKRADAGLGRGGLQEFQTEISLLSKLRHRHLVSLLGYCLEGKEMILVYNFMERGTLRENLYRTIKGRRNPPLPWKRRLEICIGAARGLHYLHTGITPPVIHRDVKSSNILLDHNWEAKLSDFGLSKTGPSMIMSKSDKHISTAVRGTFGYVDPEYLRRMALTEKSDVYSFGVVLFEVLCARPAIISVGEHEDERMISLTEWVLELLQEGNLDQAIDPCLRGMIDASCLETFIGTAKQCLEEKAKDRPSIGDVLSSLELAWQLQCANESKMICGTANKISDGGSELSTDYQPSPGSTNSDKNLGIEFSEIIYPLPR